MRNQIKQNNMIIKWEYSELERYTNKLCIFQKKKCSKKVLKSANMRLEVVCIL